MQSRTEDSALDSVYQRFASTHICVLQILLELLHLRSQLRVPFRQVKQSFLRLTIYPFDLQRLLDPAKTWSDIALAHLTRDAPQLLLPLQSLLALVDARRLKVDFLEQQPGYQPSRR